MILFLLNMDCLTSLASCSDLPESCLKYKIHSNCGTKITKDDLYNILIAPPSKPNLRDVPLSLPFPPPQSCCYLAGLVSDSAALNSSFITLQLTQQLYTLHPHYQQSHHTQSNASDQIETIIDRECFTHLFSDCLYSVSSDWFSHGRDPPPFLLP